MEKGLDLNKGQIENYSNNQLNSKDIAEKYYGAENSSAAGFLQNSEFNEMNNTFKPEIPEYEEENGINSFDDSNIYMIHSSGNFEEKISNYDFDIKNNNDSISESGYDKNIGVQKRDDYRFK